MHKQAEQGYILLVVFIFIQIYFLLGIAALESRSYANKLLSEEQIRRHALLAGQTAMREIETMLLQHAPKCTITPMSMEALQQQPLNWWDKYACKGLFLEQEYYYVIEVLSSYPCTKISLENLKGMDYYRITLLITKSHDETRRIMLQSTLFKESSVLSCAGKSSRVYSGRLAHIEI